MTVWPDLIFIGLAFIVMVVFAVCEWIEHQDLKRAERRAEKLRREREGP